MKRRTGVWRELERRRWECGETMQEFAQRVGLTQAQYSMVSLRRQALSTDLLAALIGAFPDLATEFLQEAGIVLPNQESAEG